MGHTGPSEFCAPSTAAARAGLGKLKDYMYRRGKEVCAGGVCRALGDGAAPTLSFDGLGRGRLVGLGAVLDG